MTREAAIELGEFWYAQSTSMPNFKRLAYKGRSEIAGVRLHRYLIKGAKCGITDIWLIGIMVRGLGGLDGTLEIGPICYHKQVETPRINRHTRFNFDLCGATPWEAIVAGVQRKARVKWPHYLETFRLTEERVGIDLFKDQLPI